ncbi:MAG: hypothetical protein ACI8YQ_001491 [Polaribacter sp.]|jgi:hypothetical protein
MNEIDLIGFIGALFILIAYFLNINKRLDTNDIKYDVQRLSALEITFRPN